MSDTYDMSRFQRLIAHDGNRVRGIFAVMRPDQDGKSWVKPHDVVIWDEGRHSGVILYSGDFTASVKGGEVSLPPHMVSERRRADVDEARSEIENAIRAVAAKFPREG